MRATKPGMIVGYALEDSAVTSTIQTFVNVSYYAGGTLKTDGTIAFLDDDLVVAATSTTSATIPTADSWGLTFRGSSWDAVSSTAITQEFSLYTNSISATSSQFSIRNTAGTDIFSLSQQGDLSIAGKLFPSLKGGGAQTDWYMFVDDTLAPTSTYMATNADGWQASTSYDLAERYYSVDDLEAGDLVTPSNDGGLAVRKATDSAQPIMGIVSTKPGFLLGAHSTNTHPIALAGRVPTKVTNENGPIAIGDRLTLSSIAGVAMKATGPGPVVGVALQTYDQAGVGLIEVFVQPSWSSESVTVTAPADSGLVRRGLAQVNSGGTSVHVSYDSIGAYPNIQVVPYGDVGGNWWIDNPSDIGFDIMISGALDRDVRFSWRVEPSLDGENFFFSDGTYAPLNAGSGEPNLGPDGSLDIVATNTTAAPTAPASSTSSTTVTMVGPAVSTTTTTATPAQAPATSSSSTSTSTTTSTGTSSTSSTALLP